MLLAVLVVGCGALGPPVTCASIDPIRCGEVVDVAKGALQTQDWITSIEVHPIPPNSGRRCFEEGCEVVADVCFLAAGDVAPLVITIAHLSSGALVAETF